MAKNQTKIIADPGKQELFIVREFEGPRKLLFKVFSDQSLLEQWLGCDTMVIKYEKFEPRAGGSYRYLSTMPGSMTVGFHGVCHDFTPPERIIQTMEYEGLPETGHVVMETTTFEELPNQRTRVTVHSVFQSVADRDGMVQAGMERGVNDSYAHLDQLLLKGIPA